MTPTRISVEGAGAFTIKVDVAKAQALLNEAGRSDLVLPSSINGEDVSVTIPASVSVAFGTCPDPAAPDTTNGFSSNGSAGRQYPDCVILAEVPTPTVSAPADLNISQLAQIGLEFTGMTSQQGRCFHTNGGLDLHPGDPAAQECRHVSAGDSRWGNGYINPTAGR